MNRKINVLGATYKIEEIKEQLIDWLAIQFPKIQALFEKAGVTS